jgi:phosphotriesterase-related protein
LPRRIQTVDGPIPPDAAGIVLAHEHLWAAFGDATGDPDLDFTCEPEILDDLIDAARAGVRTVVDVTTRDMGADVERSASLGRRAGIQVVKSTGWFRSPTADGWLNGRPTEAIADGFMADLTGGIPGTGHHAGCLGEVGLTGTAPTAVEERILDATAHAAIGTGAGVALHTDDAANADALVQALLNRGVAPDRLLLGHARVADPVDWQAGLLERGCVLGFDQLGHSQRDGVEAVADRVGSLLERVPAGRIVLSSDVGRRSRLRAAGGSGYASAPLRVLGALQAAETPAPLLRALSGGTAAAFLAMEAAA